MTVMQQTTMATLLSEQLLQIASAMSEAEARRPCIECDHWRQICSELETRLKELSTRVNEKCLSPPIVLAKNNDCADSFSSGSMDFEMSPANLPDVASGSSDSSFVIIDRTKPEPVISPADPSCRDFEDVSHSACAIESSMSIGRNFESEHCHHSNFAQNIDGRFAELSQQTQHLQLQLEAYKDDFEIEQNEKVELSKECEKLRRQLEVARAENADSLKKWRDLESEVHSLRDDNLQLRSTLRKFHTENIVVPSASYSALPSVRSPQRTAACSPTDACSRNSVPCADGWKCSHCSHQHDINWSKFFCEKCGALCER